MHFQVSSISLGTNWQISESHRQFVPTFRTSHSYSILNQNHTSINTRTKNLNNNHWSSSSSSYSFNVRDPKTHTVFQASALARVGPPVIFLQAQRSCAISSFIPIAFMSLLTQLLHVFLGAPLSTTPITFILVHFFTQLFSSFRSTCPNHLNLPLCILFSTHSMPKRFKSSSLRFLSFKDTPHILLTIILSALLNLARSSAFIAQVSLPYTNTLCTQASYIFPFSFKETPLFWYYMYINCTFIALLRYMKCHPMEQL